MRLVALLCMPLVIACSSGSEAKKESLGAPSVGTQAGSLAPSYSAVGLRGDSVSLSALRGKVVLLNVWATWCHPCRTEIPELEQIHTQHHAQGLEVVGVSVDATGSDDAIRSFMQEFRMTYTVWRDPDERVSALFYMVGVPATLLIDRAGVIRWRHTGPIPPGDASLNDAITKALAA